MIPLYIYKWNNKYIFLSLYLSLSLHIYIYIHILFYTTVGKYGAGIGSQPRSSAKAARCFRALRGMARKARWETAMAWRKKHRTTRISMGKTSKNQDFYGKNIEKPGFLWEKHRKHRISRISCSETSEFNVVKSKQLGILDRKQKRGINQQRASLALLNDFDIFCQTKQFCVQKFEPIMSCFNFVHWS